MAGLEISLFQNSSLVISLAQFLPGSLCFLCCFYFLLALFFLLFLGWICFSEFIFWKIILQTFLCLFVFRKVGQRKTFSSQRKIWLGFQDPEVVKNLEMSLFADYIKFDPQTFDCYI